jgi:hypothetical protein
MKLTICALATLALAADAPPLEISGDLTVDAKVHGLSARLRIDPGGPGMPVFNPDYAGRAQFRSGMFGSAAQIGPVRVSGRTAVIRLDLGQGAFKRRVSWFPAPFTRGADGIVGPGALPEPRIRFALRAPSPGERSFKMALVDFGARGMGVRVPASGREIDIAFTSEGAETVATAAAGVAIADAHGGRFDRAPETMPIMLEVVRPVRHLALATPFAVGPLSLSGLLVRTGDFGSTAGVPEANAPAPDPDEIVVTGVKEAKKRRLFVKIGSDDLSRCSSILFDKPARTVTLSCG